MKKKTNKFIIAVLLVAAVLLCIPAFSATKKKVTKPTTNKARLGTTQLDGNNAQIGTTYTLGKINPINITLNKVEYTLEPVFFGNDPIWPKKDEKIMVLHYTLHNPNRSDFGLAWNNIEINAVDSSDKNWRFHTNVAIEATHECANMALKPAQKTKVYACIVVPAKSEIPKVILQSSDRLVLRYDLRGKALPLPTPIADPADPSGATALQEVPAKIGEWYPCLGLHEKIDSIAFSTDPVNGEGPKKGCRYLVVKGTAKNNTFSNDRFVWSTFKPKVIDSDGANLEQKGEALYASRDENLNAEIGPGKELHFRYVFNAPEGASLKNLEFSQSGSHIFLYDLSQLQ